GTTTLGPLITLSTIRDKYGPPSVSTHADGTVAQTLLRKPRRPIQYHWYGEIGFITESDLDNVIGIAIRGDTLKQLWKEPDLKIVAERCLENERRVAIEVNCQGNLRQLDKAKRRWAKDTGREEGDTAFALHIIDYLPGRA